MPELMGRKVTISQGDPLAVIATARTKSLTINNESVDVTSDTDDGIQRFLDAPGQKSVEISVEGMFDTTDDTLPTLALSNSMITDMELSYGSGNYSLTGSFFMSSYSEGQTYNDATTFNATFASSGAVVKAAVA